MLPRVRPLARFVLVVFVVLVGSAPPAAAVYVSPQMQSLTALRAASAVSVDVTMDAGIARTLRMDVPLAGATANARAQTFLALYGDLFTDANDPDLDLVPAMADQTGTGQDVIVLQQTFRGLPVFGARVVLVIAPSAVGGPIGRGLLSTSSTLPAVQIDVVPTITESAAFDSALLQTARPGDSAFGKTKLLIFDPRSRGESGPARLVYAIQLAGDGSVRPPRRVFVDAHSSAVVFEYDLVYESAGLTAFDFDLFDANGRTNAGNLCMQYKIGVGVDLIGNESGLLPLVANDVEFVTTWNAIRAAYLLFHDSFGLHSWDDADALIPISADSGVDNASYSPSCDNIQVRDGFASRDVIIHEFTHGVIAMAPSDLVYNGQSGALNEAYADTMTAVPDTDWLIAEDRTSGDGANRSMFDPPGRHCGPPSFLGNCLQPDRMSQFVVTSADNAGVHTNSGIINKAHYLMGNGGSFNGVTVAGIGRAKMGILTYVVMRSLPQNATFLQARNASVSTAGLLVQFNVFGFTNANLCSVRNAFAAVELGAPDLNCDGVEEGTSDSDGDGVSNASDNCDFAANPDQKDWNSDGTGDVCDPAGDDDNDGIPNSIDTCPFVASQNQFDWDGDGLGNVCDSDDDNDGILDGADNCKDAANADQLDTDGDGEGNACDPDADLDGFDVEVDNCTFVFNPNQLDTDGDGLGDVCDKCPNVTDNANAYTIPPFPGGTPQPLQPDSDGDGTPDACDTFAFGNLGISFGSIPFNPTQPAKPDGARRTVAINGPAGGRAKLPFPPCDPLDPDGLTRNEVVELVFTGLDDTVRVLVSDETGRQVGLLRPFVSAAGVPPKGLRFRPDCSLEHFLEIETLPGFPGSNNAVLVPRVLVPTGDDDVFENGDETLHTAPLPLPDVDRDGILDANDTCPNTANPENFDRDGDRVGDVCDNCPTVANADQLDRGGVGAGSAANGRGDRCECGDVNNDGRVSVSDATAIVRSKLVPPRATLAAPERCDVGGSAGCSVADATILRRALLVPPTSAITQACVPASLP